MDQNIYVFQEIPNHLSYRGGPVVGAASLQLLFWGDFWNTATNPSLEEVTEAVSAIIDSPYLSELAQYGFQSLTLNTPLVVTQPGPSVPMFSGENVKDMVWDLIDNDIFPEPDDEGGRIIYVVFAPRGANYEASDAGGAHGDAVDIDFPGTTDHAWVAWVNHGSLDDITSTFSHELVETITDPEPSSGWTFDGMPLQQSEIADLSFSWRWMVDGFAVEPYYSSRLAAAVVPGYALVRSLLLSATAIPVGGERFFEAGQVTIDRASKCFAGTYSWELFGQGNRVTVKAQTETYVKPSVEWTVNGLTAFTFPKTLIVAADLDSDPLQGLTPLPPEQATVSYLVDDAGSLVLEMASGEAPGHVTVYCKVKEDGLPLFFIGGGERHLGRDVFLSGRRREMDARYVSDLNKCFEGGLRIAKLKLIDQKPVKIDKGDPPHWVEHDLGFLSGSVRQPLREASFMAHLIGSGDAKLAHEVRVLARGKLALVRNQRLSS